MSNDAAASDRNDNSRPLRTADTFDALFIAEYPKMVALAAAVSGNRLHAEDIAQEAMVKLGDSWAGVQGFDRPGAWLRRVTINLALSQKRRFVAEAKAKLRLDRTAQTLPPSAAEHEPVWDAVAALPGKQRAAIALRYLEDATIEEIADILDVSPSTARVHLHRGRQALRDKLADFNPTAAAPNSEATQ